MSFMTPILMVPSVYCACAPGHPRVTASAVRLMSRFIGVSQGSVFWPWFKLQDSHGAFRTAYRKVLSCPCLAETIGYSPQITEQYDPAACFMRLSRITRTAVSAGKLKPQPERQPEILR